MKSMIFAAGLGTRLKPLTDRIPKALLPLAGKTLLQWQIERLRDAGITDIVVNIHHLGQQIIDYLAENRNFGCCIRLSDERDMLLETGGGLLHAFPDGTQEPVLVCNVDILSNIDLQKFIAAHNASKKQETRSKEQGTTSQELLATVVVSDRETQRYLLFDGEGVLRGWTNRKTSEYRPASAATEDLVPMAFSGMQIVEPAFFDVLRDVEAAKGKKFSLIDAYLAAVETSRGIVRAYVPRAYTMMDVGKIDQLDEAEHFAAKLQ